MSQNKTNYFSAIMKQLKNYLFLFRVRQWTKNLFIFAALIFSKNFLCPEKAEQSLLTFILFCLLSSGVYIVNDIFDLERDKLHPIKKNRPLASGKVKHLEAVLLSFLLISTALISSFLMDTYLGGFFLLYFVLNIFYTLVGKKEVILDIVLIAFFFVIRAAAGAVAIRVFISPWLLICTFFLALFLAVIKRRQEVFLYDRDHKKREVLKKYSLGFLEDLSLITAGICIVSYAFYTFESNQNQKLIMTIPLVVYGIFRYLFLVREKDLGEDPSLVFLQDKKILFAVLSWGILSIIIVGLHA